MRHRSAEMNDPPNIVNDDDSRLEDYYQLARREYTIIRSAYVVVSYSFNVVTVKMTALYVGKEEQYSSLNGTIVSIYRDDVYLLGFFHEIVLKLLSDIVCITIIRFLAYYINKYILKTKELGC